MKPRTSRSTEQLPGPAPVPVWRRGLQNLRRAGSWHRRKLAVGCAVAAVLTGLTALAPPRPDTVPVLRARSEVPGGTALTAADVRVDHLARDALPSGALVEPGQAVGKVVVGRVPAGQVLSDADLLAGRSSPGRVRAPLRVADDEVATLLGDGDLVDVLAADEQSGRARVVASRVRVLGRPARGSTLDPGAGDAGGLVLVEVDRAVATALAQAAVGSRLSVIWR